MSLRFDDRVVIITGAGNGLGRCHALAFAARGARVVVNDLGGTGDGTGENVAVAEQVVREILDAGGTAIANSDPVQEGQRIVEQALDEFGRIDVLVNNAGILRDVSFHKMDQGQWDVIYETHLLGAYRTSRAAWPAMREAGFGRIIMTASAAGLYGNFGQANYAAAKLGLVGLASTLAIEGAGRNIRTNVIAPVAASRLTAAVMPSEVLERIQPEYVTPVVLKLCHETHGGNGEIFEVGAGWVSAVRWEQSAGKSFDVMGMTAESIDASWSEITDYTDARHRKDVAGTMAEIGQRIGVSFGLQKQ